MSFNMKKLSENVLASINKSLAAEDYYGSKARVYHKGELVFETCQGWADKPNNKPLKEDSIFRMASMTKPIIAAAILIAEQEGLIDSVMDSAAKYLPEFFSETYLAVVNEDGTLSKGEKVDMKIYQLLSHSSGLAGGFDQRVLDQMNIINNDNRKTVTDAVRLYTSMLVGYVPGTCCGYCSYAAFDACAEIITRVSGMPFEQFIQTRIFDPLEMVDTTFTPTKQQWDRLVCLTNKSDGKIFTEDMEGHIFERFPLTYHSGGAATVSTIEDYSHFALMLASGGVYKGKRILTEQSIKEMSTDYIPVGTMGRCYGQGWGLGVRVVDEGRVLPAGTFGWSGAYGTHFWVDTKNDIVGIFMKNSKFDGGSEASTSLQFERDVMDAFEA